MPKHKAAKLMPSTLVDDNENINKAWVKHGGLVIDAKILIKILQICFIKRKIISAPIIYFQTFLSSNRNKVATACPNLYNFHSFP